MITSRSVLLFKRINSKTMPYSGGVPHSQVKGHYEPPQRWGRWVNRGAMPRVMAKSKVIKCIWQNISG